MKPLSFFPYVYIFFLFQMPVASANVLPAVTYTSVEEQPVVQTKHYLGRIEAINHVNVITRTDGFVKSVHFTEGQMVEAGDLLLEIDSAVHTAVVEQAQAAVKSSEASLELATILHERLRPLLNSRSVSRTDVDKSATDYAVAAAGLQQAKAALNLAELELGFTRITAPISGRAGLLKTSIGDYIHQGSGTLVDIAQLDPVRIVIAVREADFLDASSGLSPTGFDLLGKDFVPQIRLANGHRYPEKGVLDAVANTIDPMTGTVEVRARIPNPQYLLLPGGTVDVTLDTQEPALRPAVLAIALQQDRNGYFVMVLNEQDRVERRSVSLGQQNGQYYIVQEGLNPGERVIVDGVQRIRPGIQVAPVKHVVRGE